MPPAAGRGFPHRLAARHELNDPTLAAATHRAVVPLHRNGNGTNVDVASLDVLVQRVACGSQQAFAEVYRQVSPRVMGLVVKVLRDRAQCEEVTQEVFLLIWQNASRFDEARGTALAWIFRIAHGRAVDRIRSAQRIRERDFKVGVRDCHVDFDSVTEAVEMRVENARVMRAMTRLTPLQREAIALAYFGGHSYGEAAKLLRVPTSTLKTRVRDGMIRLRRELGVQLA